MRNPLPDSSVLGKASRATPYTCKYSNILEAVFRPFVCLIRKRKPMKILKTMICAALLVAGLSGCEKIDVNKLEGTWSEQYDPTVFAMDGSVTFTFDGNNGYQLHVYDALSGESHDYSGHYAIDLINKGTITINPAMSDFSNVTYKLVKLTSKEMEWQKEGTTYSQGTWGSDYRHFVRGK